MIALLIAANSPAIAAGLVAGLGLGYIAGAAVYFHRGYQLGRRIIGKPAPPPEPPPEPQAPRPLPWAKRDHQERDIIHLARIAPRKGKHYTWPR